MKTASYVKMITTSLVLVIGGPALVMWVSPTEEELFKRYSPELQKKVLEERPQREREMQAFADQMREYSKSDKPIWVLQAEDAKKKRKALWDAEKKKVKDAEDMKAAMLKEQMEEAQK